MRVVVHVEDDGDVRKLVTIACVQYDFLELQRDRARNNVRIVCQQPCLRVLSRIHPNCAIGVEVGFLLSTS